MSIYGTSEKTALSSDCGEDARRRPRRLPHRRASLRALPIMRAARFAARGMTQGARELSRSAPPDSPKCMRAFRCAHYLRSAQTRATQETERGSCSTRRLRCATPPITHALTARAAKNAAPDVHPGRRCVCVCYLLRLLYQIRAFSMCLSQKPHSCMPGSST